MRNVRPPGPPSTQSGPKSGSSSSGRGLVREYPRSRGHPPGVFVPADPGNRTSKKRTKAIIILGIALPVLACIIGIAAWAVTTDVLRISPRPHDNAFNRFGHQGKTRIDSLQSRNDQDVDIFQLHSISSTEQSIVMKENVKPNFLQIPTNSPTQLSKVVEDSPKPPKASDILSKLLSDMPIPKNPKQFVVFAPVADSPMEKNLPNGRRFDGKVILHDGEDLVAEESILSEEVSRESIEHKYHAGRKKKSSRERSFKMKSEDINPLQSEKNAHIKKNVNPHHFPTGNTRVEAHSDFIKKPHKKDEFVIHLPRVSTSFISNRNSDGFHSRPNANDKLPMNGSNNHVIKKQELHVFENTNAAAQQGHRRVPPQYQLNKGNGIPNFPLPSHISENAMQFQNQGKNSYASQNNGNNDLKNKSAFHNAQKQFISQQLLMKSSSPNQLSPPHHNQQNSGLNQAPQRSISNSQIPSHQSLQYSGSNQRQQAYQAHTVSQSSGPLLSQSRHPALPPPSSFQGPPPQAQQHSSFQGPPPQAQTPSSFQGPHPQSQKPSSFQGPPHQAQPPSFQGPSAQAPPPPSFQGPPNQSTGPTIFNDQPQYLQNMAAASNNGPQYFAPPPQTFHTKTSYDKPLNKFQGSSSATSYERAAQSTIEHPKDDRHHHHHHHHHHEPITSNSDPIGDINLSDVPRTNDADRLGTIGLGLGGPRGITVQIGGGGGGLTGLLPLGALGIARNVISSLLPRPSFGLNSKVFLGVEVGRGGGLSLLG